MYIHAKITAGARKEELTQVSPDHFEVKVREKAERNQANARLIALLSLHFSVPTNKIRIVNGHRSPSKLIVIDS